MGYFVVHVEINPASLPDVMIMKACGRADDTVGHQWARGEVAEFYTERKRRYKILSSRFIPAR